MIENTDKYLNDSLTAIDKIIVNETQALESFIFLSVSDFANNQSERYFRSVPTEFVGSFVREALSFRSELADSFAVYYIDILKLVSERHRQAKILAAKYD